MEFGKIAEIGDVDWTIPPDSELSLQFLRSLQTKTPPTYYLGTPAWGHKEWVGLIYPPSSKPADYLRHYSRVYQCIELNTAHYGIPDVKKTQKWLEQVPESFLFCPKVYQQISHTDAGLLDSRLHDSWFGFLEQLGENLGPCFIQFPPGFYYGKKALLHQFLRMWPREFELAVEFRHPSWFENGQVRPLLVQYLQSKNIGLVITDVAGRRDVVHSSVSADFTMLRFIGNDLDPSDEKRIIEWSRRLGTWTRKGLQRVFLFVHEPEDLKAPQMTQVAIKHLIEEADADLPPITFFS